MNIKVRMVALWATGLCYLFSSCATSPNHPAGWVITNDGATSYLIDEGAGGFNLQVRHTKYQFVPEPQVVANEGEEVFSKILEELKPKRGRWIRSGDHGQMQSHTERNGFSGITTWVGEAWIPYGTAGTLFNRSVTGY